MLMLNLFGSFFFGFIWGLIPFSYLLGRLKGVDIKKIGSGNIGATNLGRALGLRFFIFGFLLDGLKGFLPVMLGQHLTLSPALCGAGAIMGHIFNPFFKFKGGKGVSTTLGVTLGIVPIPFLLSISVWLIVYLASYIVSIASLSLAIVLLITTIFFSSVSAGEKLLIATVSLLIIFAHRANIKRIINRTEPRTIFWEKK
ncbi:MAG: glycerol-3-phosphate 1-O-acyltransferase PlsY [candidate division WOR-3 bacterium]